MPPFADLARGVPRPAPDRGGLQDRPLQGPLRRDRPQRHPPRQHVPLLRVPERQRSRLLHLDFGPGRIMQQQPLPERRNVRTLKKRLSDKCLFPGFDARSCNPPYSSVVKPLLWTSKVVRGIESQPRSAPTTGTRTSATRSTTSTRGSRARCRPSSTRSCTATTPSQTHGTIINASGPAA